MIRVESQAHTNLQRYFSGELARTMAGPSTMGGITDALERGALCQLGGKSGEIREAAASAARVWDDVRKRLHACSDFNQRVLGDCYTPGDASGLESYGTFPLAAHRCPYARRVHALRARKYKQIEDWLRRLPIVVVTAQAGRDRAIAKLTVEKIRSATELMAVAALREYGAEVEHDGRRLDTVSLRELAAVLGVDHHTAATRLDRKSVPRTRSGNHKNAPWIIRVQDLETFDPEAARAWLRS